MNSTLTSFRVKALNPDLFHIEIYIEPNSGGQDEHQLLQDNQTPQYVFQLGRQNIHKLSVALARILEITELES